MKRNKIIRVALSDDEYRILNNYAVSKDCTPEEAMREWIEKIRELTQK